MAHALEPPSNAAKVSGRLDAGSNAAQPATGSNAAKLATANPEAKNALMQELRLAIEFAEQEQSPEPRAVRQRRPAPLFPAQLPQPQLVTTPPDGLCLSHACIGAVHAQKWRDEHGEKGYRLGENRSEEQAEEKQAVCVPHNTRVFSASRP